MKQIEITVKVNNSLEEIDNILKSKGFKIIKIGRAEDKYMCPNNIKVSQNNILNALSSSVLIRCYKTENKEFNNITYKDKKYDKNNILITEEKINVSINDIKSAYKLFEKLNFKNLVDVKCDTIIYSNDDLEFILQNVEGLGLLLEFENNNDFEGVSNEIVIKGKHKMHSIIKDYGISIENDFDIKKAYELILNKLKNEDVNESK